MYWRCVTRIGHGGRKIARCLENVGIAPPALSTVHGILCRHSRIKPPIASSGAYQRFEMEAPNLLWQMDFKGWVPLANQARCHPLTIVDDHSRFAVCLAACANEQSNTVQGQLEISFGAMACRKPCSWITAPRGATHRARAGHVSGYGC